MKRLFAVVVALGMAGTILLAQTGDPVKDRLEKSPRHHEWVKIKTKKGREVKTFVVFPEVNKPATAVVVIHENKGLTDWVRSVADQLAEAGYVALAPDLLSEMGTDKKGTDSFKSAGDATKALYQLTDEQVMSDLDAVVAYARDIKAANKKVGVAGFCWGGGKAFSYATHNPNIDAAFVFYGSAPKDKEAYKTIKAPVYGFYGGNDNRITGAVPDVTGMMKAAGKTFEPVTYEGAGHGFMRSGEMPDATKANKEGREAAWKRWKDILKKL